MDQLTDPDAWPAPPPTFPTPHQPFPSPQHPYPLPQQSFPFPADGNHHQPQFEPPSYPEMIITAITALKEKEGSSRQAIAKYIQSVFPNLPPNHPTLLTWHLKKMKTEGSLALVKHSYALPGTVPDYVPAPENPNPVASATPTDSKRKRGRPPKAKTPAQPSPMTVVPFPEPNAETMLVSLGLVDVPSPASSPTPVKRGRGRPPRAQSGFASPGPDSAEPVSTEPVPTGTVTPGSDVAKRSRGRPPRAIRAATLHPASDWQAGPVGPRKRGRPVKMGGKQRGRPRKVVVVGAGVGGVGAGVAVKRRGRPPRAGGPVKKLRRLSGKPLGRPKKNAMALASNQNMVAYQDLKNKVEHMQSRVKQAVDLVRPYFTSENAPYVYGALQELEELANMDMTAPPEAPPEAQPEAPLPPVTQS